MSKTYRFRNKDNRPSEDLLGAVTQNSIYHTPKDLRKNGYKIGKEYQRDGAKNFYPCLTAPKVFRKIENSRFRAKEKMTMNAIRQLEYPLDSEDITFEKFIKNAAWKWC